MKRTVSEIEKNIAKLQEKLERLLLEKEKAEPEFEEYGFYTLYKNTMLLSDADAVLGELNDIVGDHFKCGMHLYFDSGGTPTNTGIVLDKDYIWEIIDNVLIVKNRV